jgi:hypothetical protein
LSLDSYTHETSGFSSPSRWRISPARDPTQAQKSQSREGSARAPAQRRGGAAFPPAAPRLPHSNSAVKRRHKVRAHEWGSKAKDAPAGRGDGTAARAGARRSPVNANVLKAILQSLMSAVETSFSVSSTRQLAMLSTQPDLTAVGATYTCALAAKCERAAGGNGARGGA